MPKLPKKHFGSKNSIGGAEVPVNAMQRFETAVTGIDRQKQAFLLQAARALIPLVRQMIAANYNKSGLRTRTGKDTKKGRKRPLLEVLGKVTVTLTRKGIRIALPRGLDEKLYVQASALNFGYVKAPIENRTVADYVTGATRTERRSVLGERSKRTIKRAALKGKKLSSRSRKRIEADSFNLHGQKHSKSSVNLSDVTVVPPRPFFFITEGQRDTLQTVLIREYQKRIDGALKASGTMVKKAS